MLYFLVKLLAITGIRTFYDRIIVKNLRYIPESGPLIFAANHPSTMMDPIIIGYACPRRLYFLAKATLFKRPLNRWFLTRLGLIPVYRRQDDPELVDKNVETFSCCYELLEQGKSLLIFPEGISTGERIIGRIKTGAARIGFGAEERNAFSLGVQIIPVGLNYSNVVKFRSEVYVRFGQPIPLREYREQYEQEPVAAVKEVTGRIETALSKLTTTVKELELEGIVSALENIYKKELIVDLGMQPDDSHADFAVTKGLINAVEWFYERYPERVEHFKALLERYQHNLERLHLRDEFFSPVKSDLSFWKRFRSAALLIIGFPIFIYGFINNYIPYKFPRWYAQHFVMVKSQWASMKMVIGAAVFLVYYALEISVVAALTSGPVWPIVYAFTLVPSGNFVLRYLRWARNYRQHLRFLSIFYQKRLLVYKLIQQRLQLVQYLNDAKREYMQAVGLNPSDSATK
jgi:1-acyl-sn-glycerol-3-phosphate acyltransferase